MAEKLDELYYDIIARDKKLKQDLKRLEKDVGKSAKKSGKLFDSTFGKFALAGGGILALKKAIDFSIQFKNAARDAEETRNKFATVFSSIKEEAKGMAESFASSFGLANSTAQELLGNTGDLLVGFGFTEVKALELSTSVNKLAQDLASFTNFAGGASGASAALTKALLGETESAKSLGIVIRQDTKEFRDQVKQLQETTGATRQQAKSMVILEEAYRQSDKAVGDYARTSNSLANQERRANEEYKEMSEVLGKELIPAFTGLTKAAIGWTRLIKSIVDTLKGIGIEIAESAERIAEAKTRYSQMSKEELKAEKEILSTQWDRVDAEAEGLKLKKEYGVSGLNEDEKLRLKTLESQLQNLREQSKAIDAIKAKIDDGGEGETITSYNTLNDEIKKYLAQSKDLEIGTQAWFDMAVKIHQVKQEIKEAKKAAAEFIFNLSPAVDASGIKAKGLTQQKSKGLKTPGVLQPVDVPDAVNPLEGINSKIQESTSLASTWATTLSRGFTAIVSGSGDVTRALGQIVQQLAMAVVKGLLFRAIFAAIDPSGQLAGTASSFIPSFATGVRNFKGGYAMVGEEGPELVKLPAGSDVYNHIETSGIVTAEPPDVSGISTAINSLAQPQTTEQKQKPIPIYGRLDGNDLYISNNRAEKRYKKIR